ncbi:anion permease [Escherichia coli]
MAVIAIIALIPVSRRAGESYLADFAVFTGVSVGLILEPVPGAVVAMVGISIIAIRFLAAVQPGAARSARL